MSAHDWLSGLAADLGEAAVSRFVARAAGMRLYVPGPAKVEGSVLHSLGGPAVAMWMAARYAGDYIDVPSGRAAARDSLRQAVAAEPDAPVNELAHRYGVTARRVLQVRAGHERDGAQDDPPLLAAMRNTSSAKRGR